MKKNKIKKAQDKIKKAFLELIQDYEINEISVTNLVKKAQVNRSTFYVNYLDINDLIEQIKKEMYYNLLSLYQEEAIKQIHSYDYLKLFKHIKENQNYYRTMFKLDFDFLNYYDNHLEKDSAIEYYGTIDNLDYHITFFKAGIRAIIKKWLQKNCQESPEVILEILKNEYKGKIQF